jgi:diguanylate cyclase (GGDEF)-like protein
LPGIAAGAAGSILVTLGDVLIGPNLALVTPLALVVVFVAWLSTPTAIWFTVLFGSVIWAAENVVMRSPGLLVGTLVLSVVRIATLGLLGFTTFQLRRTLAHAAATAVHDDLTGLLNRRGFVEQAEREVARARREGTPLTIAVMDLDKFKSINDAYGHAAGDEALKRFAEHASARLRGTDVIGRTGGDEFALLLPLGANLAAGIIREVSEIPYAEGLPELRASVGAVSYATAPASLDEALAAADKQMYAAKQAHSGLKISVFTG